MPRKITLKPRNAWTMTESAFRWMIRSCLRMKSRWWLPLSRYKKSRQLKYIWENKRRKRSYKCEQCWWIFDDKQVEINHIIPAGSLTCWADLEWFVERLFCESWFELICKNCHKNITAEQKLSRKK